ncbi:hypothetical protein BOTBODRAFT_168993 [Botryobasidium botryosum FD-172 SS1]|uniref:Uncharacterized protein n=1 Tax=Botryobasidium botryosum (strain FD-172 SS1) TaxID=930990 RepID=A0A067N1B8_BOTB1|nr:hypothetical protein BOTBODRAFT_168993 [Botryobasidium botryosum FD-172 SS1]
MSSQKSTRTLRSQARAPLLPKRLHTNSVRYKDLAKLKNATDRRVVLHYQTDSRKAPFYRYTLRILDPCPGYTELTPEEPSISPLLIVASWDKDGATRQPKWVGRRGYTTTERGKALRYAWALCKRQNNPEQKELFKKWHLRRCDLHLHYAISDIMKKKYEAVADTREYLEEVSRPVGSRIRVTTPPPVRIQARHDCDSVIERLGLPTSISEKKKIRSLELEARFTKECLDELDLPLDHPDSSDEESDADGIEESETETDN